MCRCSKISDSRFKYYHHYFFISLSDSSQYRDSVTMVGILDWTWDPVLCRFRNGTSYFLIVPGMYTIVTRHV